jgi:exopolyphosphatase/guanosine-5'-triphosphate,3'-diphosphate pyrophosphatase
MAERLGVADLGSNSFRLVEFTARDGWWKRTDEIYEAVRIGEGLGASGELGAEPMERALSTIDVFGHFCRASGLGPDEIDAVATSAIREASNGDRFLERARERFGLPIRVLSREEEARYGYLAAVNSTTLTDGAVLDLGGGSLQLTRVAERQAAEMASWPLGAVRMSEHFLPGEGPVTKKQLKALRAHVAEELSRAPWLAQSGRRLVGLGGTVRNLAAAAAAAAGLPSIGIQGHVISRECLAELVARLGALPAEERGKVPGIKPARADLILAGAAVVLAVLELGELEGLEATDAGLREGVFFERRFGLIPDVRRASVENLAAQYGQVNAHTRHVARLALRMCEQLGCDRELLWAAAMLHDIGMSVDYDDHHRHSRYLVLNGGLPGYSPRELALVAEMVRYHRKGMPSFGEDLEPWTIKGDQAILDRGATLLRLAEGLERSRDQGVRDVTVDASGDGPIVLTLEAVEDVRVAKWAVEREAELFQRAFGRPMEIRVAALSAR